MTSVLKKLYYSGVSYLTTKKIADSYIDWLCFANAGLLHKGNIYSMNRAIKNLPSDNPVLEIGSFCGLSANVISYLLFKHNRSNRIFCSDKWVFEGSESGGNLGNSSISHESYREFVKSTYMRNVAFFSAENKPYAIEVFSDEFFDWWRRNITVNDVFNREVKLGGNISFCFVDGNHTYDFARRDFENTDKYLDVGGYILFDDTSDIDAFGLRKLMKEIQNNGRYKLVMKNPNYLFLKLE